MPTLKDIAKQIRGLTVAKAPQSLKGSNRKRPGNLKRALKRANTPDKILKVDPKTKSFSFEIDYAPIGAEYGMWWNDPNLAKNIKNGKTKNIPESINFANKALDSDIVASMLDLHIEERVDKFIVQPLIKSIEQTLK